MALLVPDELRVVVYKIAKGEAPEPVTVRSLLRCFMAERRGRYAAQMVGPEFERERHARRPHAARADTEQRAESE